MHDYKKLIRQIIRESINAIFEDIDYEIESDISELQDNLTSEIFNDFFNRQEYEYERVPWTLVPFNLLRITWEKFVEFGSLPERYYKNLETIEKIMTKNIIKLKILTELSGHTSLDPEYAFAEYGLVGKKEDENPYILKIKYAINPQQLKLFKGVYTKYNITIETEEGEVVEEFGAKNNSELEKIIKNAYKNYNIIETESEIGDADKYKNIGKPRGYIEDFYDWTVDERGGEIMSDYGLQPLLNLLYQLKKDKTPEEKLVTIDKMLNVVHQRSDMASWFVEGGSRALSQLSGMEEYA